MRSTSVFLFLPLIVLLLRSLSHIISITPRLCGHSKNISATWVALRKTGALREGHTGRSVPLRPIVSQSRWSHFVPVLLCPSPVVSQSRYVTLCPSPFVSHCVPVPQHDGARTRRVDPEHTTMNNQNTTISIQYRNRHAIKI